VKTGKIVLLVVAALVCISLGIVVGQLVQAAGTQAGSESDPVVTQSYVETLVAGKLADLQTKVDELEAEIDALTGGSTTTTTTTSSTDTTNTNTDTTTATATELVKITGSSVNVRDSASIDGKKIASLVKDTKVTYLGEQGDWYKVKLSDGTVGYVSKTYSTLITQ